jgi:hypothetical protein
MGQVQSQTQNKKYDITMLMYIHKPLLQSLPGNVHSYSARMCHSEHCPSSKDLDYPFLSASISPTERVLPITPEEDGRFLLPNAVILSASDKQCPNFSRDCDHIHRILYSCIRNCPFLRNPEVHHRFTEVHHWTPS